MWRSMRTTRGRAICSCSAPTGFPGWSRIAFSSPSSRNRRETWRRARKSCLILPTRTAAWTTRPSSSRATMARRTRQMARAGKAPRSTTVEPPSPAGIGAGEHPAHERFGNPQHLEEYLRKLDDPARTAWQKPDQVLRALETRPEAVIGQNGAGKGYLTLGLAAMCRHGFAFDLCPRLQGMLGEPIGQARARRAASLLHGIRRAADPMFR